MEYRNLGKSGIKVSEICLGTMTFGVEGMFGQISDLDFKRSKEMIDIALDSGINFIDTADVYSNGSSEEVVGKAIGSRRDDLILCTKVTMDAGARNINDVGSSRHHILEACEASLKRLKTDYIDVYMLHTMDLSTPLEESLRALDDLVRQGKVRYIGCSNFSGWYLLKALDISERSGLEKFVTYQAYYSLLARETENEIIPACLDQGLGLMVWSPLSGGYLSGKFRKDKPSPKGTRIGDNDESPFIPPVDIKKAYKILDKLEEIAASHNASIAQAALNYTLSKPSVSTLVIGARKIEQLKDNISSVNWKMSPDEVKELDNISDGPLNYPYWHHKLTGVY